MVPRNRLPRNGLVACLVTCLTTTSVWAQYVPQSVSLNVSGGSLVLPQARTAEGDMLRGQGDYFKGLGELSKGQGDYLQCLGAYEVQHQNALRMAMENRQHQLELRRGWLQRVAADREALSGRREAYNIQTDLRHFRDQPDPHRVASGGALNYMLKQYGSNLASLDFTRVHLTSEELDSIQLKTPEGITSEGLAWSFDAGGRVRWPEELRLTELNSQRTRVEDALKKMRLIELNGEPVNTQLKRVRKEIDDLRSQAGHILRAKKNDEIGGNASRDFLKHLDCQIARLRSSDKQARIQMALQPTVHSASELMQHVARHNLQFAPCQDPTATAYRALHERLADAHRELHRPSQSLAATH